MRLAGPFALFKVMANVAGFVMAVAGVQILIVNRRFLPRALRPSLYRELLLAACVVFYGFFAARAALHSCW
jgi:nitrate reductase gamma subunit